MNAKQKFIILGTTLLLSGCGIYTKYEPQDTVPDNLYGEEAASLSADTTSIADIDWRDFFLTSSLKKYVFYNCLINNVLYLRVT